MGGFTILECPTCGSSYCAECDKDYVYVCFNCEETICEDCASITDDNLCVDCGD